MKLLIYGNRKQDDEIWDISTPELEAKAYLELFKNLDTFWQVYTELKEYAKQADLYQRAKTGEWQAAKDLLTRRKSYEYENFKVIEKK